MSGKRRTVLEKSVQRAIELEIGAEPDLLLFKNSVGSAKFYDDNGKEFVVPYGLGAGSPDLVGLLRLSVLAGSGGHWDGDRFVARRIEIATWFCLEVKPPEGDLEPAQRKCHEIWRSFGAFIEVARSPAEARAALERARGRTL